jgi:hypothetical protein
MAADSEDQEASQEQSVAESTSHNGDTAGNDPEAESQVTDEDDNEEREEGYEEEPKLKYARLTSHLAPVYRNGDMTSVFLVMGDKMVLPPAHQRTGSGTNHLQYIGTHNGNIVSSEPSLFYTIHPGS